MSERNITQGRDGYIQVDVEAESVMGQLPDWLDAHAILHAALAEYARQRSEAVGPLPLPEHSEAWQAYEGQNVMQ
jgi:predicted glycoside hydrolase/deacetylase ChbG (UPF0249 family)